MGTGNKVVDALARGGYLDAGEPLYLTPHTWYKHILLPSGRPDFLACLLLAEIMYWYRPVERRHEATGRPIGWRKKFRADKLQKSYSALAEQLNVTKRQVRDAMTRLDEAGLITREFRNLPAYDGLVMTNVLFVEPVLERVLAITYRDDATSEELDDALDATLDDMAEDTLESDTSDAEMYEVIHYDVPPHTPRMQTYTETSPEITAKKGKEFSPATRAAPATPRAKARTKDPPKEPQKETPPHQEMVGAICEVTKTDYKIRRVAGQAARTGKELRTAGYTPEDVRSIFGADGWWYKEHWKGKRNEPPRMDELLTEIAKGKEYAATPRYGGSANSDFWAEEAAYWEKVNREREERRARQGREAAQCPAPSATA